MNLNLISALSAENGRSCNGRGLHLFHRFEATTSRKMLRQTTGSQTDEECDGDHWSEASVRLANLEAKMQGRI